MRKLLPLLYLLIILVSPVLAQVGINSDGTNPDPSAGLDVKFSNKGFLPPRVALSSLMVAAPVISPANGLLVYNTATAGISPNNVVPGFYYWEGTRWTSLSIPTGEVGQTLRHDGTKWVANSLLYNDGTNIGIGTITTHKFTVAGTTETVRLIGPGIYGETAKLNFGDGDYVSISEDIDDKLLIHAAGRTAITGGNVGIGTTTPSQMLTVAGIIQTTSGGVMFPDGTTQNTSAANVHAIGENYGGGIVFYVYNGGRHGLIAATVDQSAHSLWYNGTSKFTGTTGDGLNAGSMNTAMVVATQMADNQTGNFAAKRCADYSVTVDGILYGDWYLPSKYELNLLYLQKELVGILDTSNFYWSSTEFDADNAWSQYFFNGISDYSDKYQSFHARAIRAF